MRKGVFKPYTKPQAIKIIRKYFVLTRAAAEHQVERLAACVTRDCLDVSKYLYEWETKLNQGATGNIEELYILYPFEREHGGL